MILTWCDFVPSSQLVTYSRMFNTQLQSMMNSPEFLQQMSSLMSNPAVLEQALALNPQFASMAPQAREIFQSERFRQMMSVPHLYLNFFCHAEFLNRSNPEALRNMLQMASMMRGTGLDPLAGSFGGPTFAPPGNPNAPGAPNTASTPATPGGGPAASGTTPAPNPFGPNPFGMDPSALSQILGAGGPGFGSGASLFGTPADTRPPEERFQVQLQVRIFVLRYYCIRLTHLPFFFSNCKIWASLMPRKMCAHCLRQVETFIRR